MSSLVIAIFLLSVALIVISIYFALFSQKIKLPTTKKVQVGAGTLSGLMGGFFGMQGPPAVLYFIQSEPTKEHYMAMAQTYFLIGNVMMTFVRAYHFAVRKQRRVVFTFCCTTAFAVYVYYCVHINFNLTQKEHFLLHS